MKATASAGQGLLPHLLPILWKAPTLSQQHITGRDFLREQHQVLTQQPLLREMRITDGRCDGLP